MFVLQSFGKNERVWKVIKEKIFEILKVKWEDRRPEDTLLVERVLVLIRNLLHTPASTEDLRRTNQELSSQDSLIWYVLSVCINFLLFISESVSVCICFL